MKGKISYKILGLLQEGAFNFLDLAEAMINSGYGAGFGKIDREIEKIHSERITARLKSERIRRLQKYLIKLKKDGLIDEKDSGKLLVTQKGNKKLSALKKSFLMDKNYEKEKSDKVIIISYDIPVAFNKERNILRDILRMLGFEIVHKSVWVGKVKLPKRFITDVEELGILDYIEILEVTKSGSLKHYS
ncbi:MAG: hypothetical protein V4439_03180 [Patescibacteria group bacterium]